MCSPSHIARQPCNDNRAQSRINLEDAGTWFVVGRSLNLIGKPEMFVSIIATVVGSIFEWNKFAFINDKCIKEHKYINTNIDNNDDNYNYKSYSVKYNKA